MSDLVRELNAVLVKHTLDSESMSETAAVHPASVTVEHLYGKLTYLTQAFVVCILLLSCESPL